MRYKGKYYKYLFSVFIAVLLWSPIQTYSSETLSHKELIEQLKSGGMVIYWRHAITDHKQVDNADLKLEDCSTQRNLSELGRQQARDIGKKFRSLKIGVGDIFSSPFCRCIQTAELAFKQKPQIDESLFFAVGLKKEDREKQAKFLLKRLSTSPPKGVNNVIVSHTANLKETTNIWPKPEGVMHIFKPEDDGYSHLGSLPPDFWTTKR
jgi:phosphohistidine phosphatase SixA